MQVPVHQLLVCKSALMHSMCHTCAVHWWTCVPVMCTWWSSSLLLCCCNGRRKCTINAVWPQLEWWSTDTKRVVFSPCVQRGALFPPSQKATHSSRHACKLNRDIRVPLPTRQFPHVLVEPLANVPLWRLVSAASQLAERGDPTRFSVCAEPRV